jgi:GT2 family glycosyltransferase/glycosyltransferase involved in cell wall biosynthesis
MNGSTPDAASPASRAATGPVLFVSYSGLWGGAERILVDVAGGLSGPVALLCPNGELASRARAAGVTVLTRPPRPRELRGGARKRLRAVLHLAAHAREVHTAIVSLRPRAVVAFGMRSAIACVAALQTVRGRPQLVFEHVDFLPSAGVGRLVRRAASRADRVVALSAAVAADLDPDGRLGERLRVALPGIDIESFTAAPPQADPPVALLLGAIVDWKRPDLALQAVAIAARRLESLRLVVAGHTVGEESERLLETLRHRTAEPDLAGRVQFAGALGDPRVEIGRASCLLHCADREPFGLVLLEAMACGRPVVAPAAGGPLEIVTDGCGRLFPPGDPQAAARALVELLGDREGLRRAGERARARVAREFALGDARRRWLEAAALPPRTAADDEAGAGLTLVTVSHDSEPELDRLLTSVARHLPGAAVVVVDSGSRDASAAVARAWRGDVRVVELENVGYGRAVNAGVPLVDTPACVVLNPDVELLDDSLEVLAAEALRPGTPERLLAPLVFRPDGTRQDSVHLEPVSAAAVVTALLPPAALPPPLRRSVQPWRADRPRAVAWAVGCCICGRTDTLRRLGPFDERIFLYGEDLELGLRARDAGIETWWWPEARVVHHQAHTARRAFGGEPVELLARQRHAVVVNRRGPRIARWDDRIQAVTFANRILLKAVLGRPNARERRQLSALRLADGARLREG